jgi:subtilisin family serine protease
MIVRRRPVALLAVPCTALALVLPAAAALPAGAAPLAAPATVDAAASATATSSTVTLLTGDVVTLTTTPDGRQVVTIDRARGATGGIRQTTVDGHVHVIPDEALPYLASGRVDDRLFDVTGLIEQGYSDERTGGIPLIVTYSGATAAATTALPGTTRLRSLRSIDGAAIRASKAKARTLWKTLTPASKRQRPALRSAVVPEAPTSTSGTALLGAGVSRVWLDGKVHAALADSTLQVGAPEAWAAGWDGSGVKVAVLDTGYDTDHPDLVGRVVESKSFVPGETVEDVNGHGTHTASTVGGSGAAAGGAEKGVAPDADLIIGKVLSDQGSGDDSWVIAGMEWAAAQGAKVVSMSLGGSDPADGSEPVCQAVNDISRSTGALFVVAAGNNGAEAAISCPGAADDALTVAAIDSSDSLAWFSSMGPRFHDYALKPDISAPGVDVLAAKAGGSAETGWYVAESGTSMATPHVAGAAAVVAEEHPTWTGQQIKDALMSSAKQLDLTAYQTGAGRLDVAAATKAGITATGSAWLGFLRWPQTASAPLARTITYTNSTSKPVALDLALDTEVLGGPYDVDPMADAGNPVPDGLFALSASKVVVPAKGTASVTVTGDPSLASQARRYGGQVVATVAGAVAARTQIGLYLEEERHDLTLEVRDRDGDPAPAYVELQKLGTFDTDVIPVGESGTLTLRMLPGTYSFRTFVVVPGVHGPDSYGVAQLADPEVVLDRDRTVSLDARKAVEVTAKVPAQTEDRILYLDWYRADADGRAVGGQYVLPGWADSMWAQPTQQVTQGALEFQARWRKAKPYLTIDDSGRDIRIVGQSGSTLYDGSRKLRVVDGGTGSVDDLAKVDAKGAFVLVRRSDAVGSMERAANAAAAGAEILGVVNDKAGPLLEYVGKPDGTESDIPVVALGRTVGEDLLARSAKRTVKLALVGTPDSPYVYDLVKPWEGRIPSTLTYAPKRSELATVVQRFHGPKADGGEFRWDYRPYRTAGLGWPLKQSMGMTRTDYLSAQPGTRWAQAVVGGPDFAWAQSSEIRDVVAGTRTTEDWLSPVAHPANGGGFWSSERYATFLNINVQPWNDGTSGHAGYIQPDINTGEARDYKHLVVWRDGVKVATSDWASATLTDLDGSKIKLKLDLQARRDESQYRWSPRTRTKWTVVSPGLSQGMDSLDTMPVLQTAYDVQTDLDGYARGGRQSVRVSVTHLADAFGAGKVRKPTLEVSYDEGRTWRTVALSASSGAWWQADFRAPQRGAVSLRLSGHDGRGNAVKQTIIRAYGLR